MARLRRLRRRTCPPRHGAGSHHGEHRCAQASAQIEFEKAQAHARVQRCRRCTASRSPRGSRCCCARAASRRRMSRVDVLERVQRQDASIVTTIAGTPRMRKARVELHRRPEGREAASRRRRASDSTEVRSIRSARRGVLHQRAHATRGDDRRRGQPAASRRARRRSATRRAAGRATHGRERRRTWSSAPAAPSSGGGGTDVSARAS